MPRLFYDQSRDTSEEGFRYRGKESTRLENLTDAIFGFSITLLVISTSVPSTYLELQASMYSFIGFVFCIMLLLSIWSSHQRFFLYYGLQDGTTKMLNFLFLFILLFYVYPLKYLFSYLGTVIYANFKIELGDQSAALRLVREQIANSVLKTEEWVDIMVRFGLGLLLIYLIFLLLYLHAYKRGHALKLNKREQFITKTAIQRFSMLMTICALSIAIALFLPADQVSLSGTCYLLIPVSLIGHKYLRKKRLSVQLPTVPLAKTKPQEAVDSTGRDADQARV